MDQPYCGPGVAPGDLWTAWNIDPPVLIGLAVLAWMLWRHGAGRAGGVAVIALAIAFVSPLCALTVALFSARAAHHLLLAGVAAPALAWAWPLARRLPAQAGAAGMAAAMAAWHLPAVYDAIWRSDAVYWAMQAALLLPAWAFWSVVLTGSRSEALGYQVLSHSFLTLGLAGVMGFLGAILTFAPGVLYLQHVDGAAMWGLGAIDDQRLAGLILWAPGFLPMAALAGWMLRRSWRQGFAA
ncbi:cytochrome c oxidase assembly protein [Paracoccus sp. WLY502]|uniref:cytochrome c oxidase assembly protein n=1 Tax=Paracoccus yibinensis TaxID=3068891 RepID=UPI0027969F17|nr:cytochrome c oxidase assembly protein [Paracoccus sp. WLY502]MDQ1899528.1 cytochrome c oxidase assembly protein [Paracoccus sp. WLY502]